MASRFKPSRGITRRPSGRIQPKIKIIAFCEGKNTEPEFIEKFSTLYGNGLVSIETVPAAGSPATIVSACAVRIKLLTKLAKKSKDPLDKNFEVWAIFDRDEHPKLQKAFDMAHANNIKVAYSNPCFEIWPYLHYKNQTASIHRKTLQKQLETCIDSYDGKGAKSICAEQLEQTMMYSTAKSRAISLENKHKEEGQSFIESNPSTNVHHLFDLIIANGKSKKSS